MESSGFNFGTTGADELIARRPDSEPPEFDITAMVDLVFMMNIYFLVTFVGAMGALNLPAARHVSALDGDSAVVLTLKRSLDGKSVTLYIGDGDKSEAINDPVQQEQRIQAAMEQGLAEVPPKKAVLLKAEKKVRAADTDRIARTATSVATEGGVKLYIGVMEKDK